MADRNEAARFHPRVSRGSHQHILIGGNVIFRAKISFSGVNGKPRPWRRCDLDEM